MSKCQKSSECIRSPKLSHAQQEEESEVQSGRKSPTANSDADFRRGFEVNSSQIPESNDGLVLPAKTLPKLT